jgi:hypothetical protein
MVLRKPNLLDAFQASAPEGKQAPPGKPPASAAGPFAHERTPHAATAPKLPMNRRSLLAQMASDRLVQFAIVACLVGVAIAFYVGRTNTQPGSAQAAGDTAGEGTILRENQGGAPQSPDPVEANRKAAALSQSTHDAAFLDPKYKFTVRAAQYPNDEAGKKAAYADRDYLRGEGLPVVAPIQLGRILVLCVGYDVSIAKLDEVLKYVKKLPGPKGGRKNPYESAYVDNISHVVARK